MTCKICEARRPRRYCPGVGGEICSVCCGTEREVSIPCPLDCEFLREAHRRERLQPLEPERVPYPEVRVSEQFLNEHAELAGLMIRKLVEAGLSTPGAVDSDIREALDALARTYRTLESGLYYDSRPNNLLAGAVYQRFADAITEFRRQQVEQAGMTAIRDADVLGVLVFLARTAAQLNNGRPRSRVFLDVLRTHVPPAGARQPRGSSLVLP